MPSMAKPKKLLIIGSDGRTYTFLAKKDDLRKDGRLMDFDAILNKLLKADSDARRRQLSASPPLTYVSVRSQDLPFRNPHLWGSISDRGMWNDSMGAQHNAHQDHPGTTLRSPWLVWLGKCNHA